MRILKKRTKQYRAYARKQRRRARKIRHHPFIVPVVTFLVLFFASIIGFIAFNSQTIGAPDIHVVNLSIDGKQQAIPTRAATVGNLLNRLNIKLASQDVVEPPLNTPIVQDGFDINIYHARPVTIIDGDNRITELTAVTDPRDVVENAGINLYPEDTVKLANSYDALNAGVVGEQLIVTHATPIELSLYGQTVDIRTQATTVRDLLKERNINDNQVSVFPSLDTPLKNDDVVYVTDPGKIVQLVDVSIPQGTSYVNDYNLPSGTTQVTNPGVPGEKVVVYEISKTDPTQKSVLQEVPVSNPVNQVISVGQMINNASVASDKAALMAAAGISPSDYYAADYIISHESGWKPGTISGSGCAGLGQACPGSKLISACSNWSENTVCQLQYFTNYAQRYGGWQGAYNAWVNVNGGWW
jgi:uncharacterized protein YabE (DUF348 family)